MLFQQSWWSIIPECSCSTSTGPRNFIFGINVMWLYTLQLQWCAYMMMAPQGHAKNSIFHTCKSPVWVQLSQLNWMIPSYPYMCQSLRWGVSPLEEPHCLIWQSTVKSSSFELQLLARVDERETTDCRYVEVSNDRLFKPPLWCPAPLWELKG